MVIVILKYTAPLERIDELLEAHRAFLRQGYERKQFLMSGPQQPRTGGVIVTTVKTKAEAERIVQEDPFLKEGAAEYQFIEFDAVWMDEGLKRLLESYGG